MFCNFFIKTGLTSGKFVQSTFILPPSCYSPGVVHGKKGGGRGCSQTCPHSGALSSVCGLIKNVLKENSY